MASGKLQSRMQESVPTGQFHLEWSLAKQMHLLGGGAVDIFAWNSLPHSQN